MAVSRSSTSSTLSAICSSALLLIAFLGNHHVTDACRCVYLDSPCSAMQDRSVLVRATIQSKTDFFNDSFGLDANGVRDPQFITNHYNAIVETVYVNNNNAGAPNVVEGQTIEIRAKISGNLCGIQLETGSDMLLDLYPESNGEYFSTNSCSMNAEIDANGVIERSEYNECFTYSSTSDSLLMNSIPTFTVMEGTYKEEEGTEEEEEDMTEDESPKPKLTKAERRRERRERRQERRERRNGTN
eukprot:scaffold7769_cov53-Attheya_sp.AAC.1